MLLFLFFKKLLTMLFSFAKISAKGNKKSQDLINLKT